MNENNKTAKVREAVVSGIFYPEEVSELKAAISAVFKEASKYRGDSRIILSPHAGFEYSGLISAIAWISSAECRPKTVAILAPYHRAEEPAVWLPESDIFQSPLGPVRVDKEYIEELESCGTIFRVNDIPHLEEHDIEVQLPFMQTLFPDASLVPILLGKPTPSAINSLAHALSLAFSDKADSILFVVSTNFSCFASVKESRERIDRTFKHVSIGDHASLYEEFKKDTPDMCGIGCLVSFMRSGLLEGANWNLLASSDSESKRSSLSEKVVFYAAGAWK